MDSIEEATERGFIRQEVIDLLPEYEADKQYWMLLKYMPDLRRREPVNVGALVIEGDTVAHQFVGDDETLDSKANSERYEWMTSGKSGSKGFCAWLESYKRSIEEMDDRRLLYYYLLQNKFSNIHNLYFDLAGELLFGEKRMPEVEVGILYRELVIPKKRLTRFYTRPDFF